MKLKQQLHKVYSSLGPGWQTAIERFYAIVPMKLRKKRGFLSYLEFLRNSQWASSEWHEEYQYDQLQELLKYVSNTSPYYQNIFTTERIDINDIKSLSDLISLPILVKSQLIERISEFLPTTFPKSRLIVNSTSGSTGTPFNFSQDYYAVMREEAFTVRHWENSGMQLGEPTVYLRSYIPGSNKSLYKFSPTNNRHYFSAYHLDQSNLPFYLDKIRKSGARFIFGYPSALEIFADLMLDVGEQLEFKAAITGSEKLTDTARVKIAKSLNTKVFDWYGLAEPTVTMGQCESGNYHVFSEYGILELIDSANNPVTEEGKVGRIVGTNFTNRALPLIRYDTGDLGTLTTRICDCGRGTPVMISSVEGRKDDLLIGANGQYLPSVNFYTLFAHLGDEIKRFQLIQSDRTKFSLKLIRGPEFNEESVKVVLKGLIDRIGGRPDIMIKNVERIAPTRSGKIRAVVREFNPIGNTNQAANEN